MKKLAIFFAPSLMLASLAACNGGAAGTSPTAPVSTAKTSSGASSKGSKKESLGTSCSSDDPNKICLAVSFVAYSKDGKEVVTEAQAEQDIQGINKVWEQCGVAFELDKYAAVNPVDYKLDYNTRNQADLDDVRRAFMDNETLLVTVTGTWDRTGTLGNTGANAWTSMPGEGIYGAILEDTVGTFSNIIGHELGHYLSLDHVSDTSNLMNPVIYDSSIQLSQDQCNSARAAAGSYWKAMQR
jgi:hypothetical protein